MAVDPRPTALFAIVLLFAACDTGPSAASSAATAEPVTRTAPAPAPADVPTETISARFTGWNLADGRWARIDAIGRGDLEAQPGSEAIAAFLQAHPDRPLELVVARLPVGGYTIVDARAGGRDAAGWWASLNGEQRRAAAAAVDAAVRVAAESL